MNRRVASPPSMSSSSFLTTAVRMKKEEEDEDEDEVEPPTVVSSSLSAVAISATSMRLGRKKEEAVDNGNGNETGAGNSAGGPRHGSVHRTVKKEEEEDDDHQHSTHNSTTIPSSTMVPDAAISSSSSNSNSSRRSGGTENNNSTNDNGDNDRIEEEWGSGNWCWLDDQTSNDVKLQKEEAEGEEKEAKVNNSTNGDDDTVVKREKEEYSDSPFDKKNSMSCDDDTGAKKEEEEGNDNSFDHTNNSRNSDDDTEVEKEEEENDNGRGFDTTSKNKNNRARTDATVSDNTITAIDDYYDDWTTGNWCLEGRPHSTTTMGRSSAVGPAAATLATVSTSTRNKRKLKQSRENHNKKKPRIINQNNTNNNNNNTTLDEDDNNDGLHDEGNDDGDDDDDDDDDDDNYDGNYDDNDDDDDYSDVDCDDSNDDESEPDNSSGNSVVVAKTSMHNGGAIVRKKDEERWNKMYGRLLKYKKKYKSTSVPFRFDDDLRLGNWVRNQREMYKNKSLSAERIDRLTSISFVWNEYDAQWTMMYERLVTYKHQYNSTCVPRSYTADPQLATWVRNQRPKYNKLTTERKYQLNSIGFICDPFEAQWLEMYDRLVQYKKEYKTTCVPKPYRADPQLAIWVSKQRTHYNTNSLSLTKERRHQLNSIGFVWDPFDKRWTEMYERLVAYKNQYKSTCVPSIYKDDPQLAQWVRTQRTNYNRNSSSLTADRIKLLNSIDFIWKTRKYGRNV